MARNAIVKEILVLIIYGLYLFSNAEACLPDSDDLAAIVLSSPIVLEGRVELTKPSAFQPSDSGFFDAVLSVETVFKGQLDGGVDAESYERIVVGPFGTSKDEDGCVGGHVEVGGEFIVFLNASDESLVEVSLRHFRLLARPRLADPDSRTIAKEQGCHPDCTTPPSRKNPHAALCVDNGYCLNGGTCYVMPTLGLRFCQCRPEFQDYRCQEKKTSIGEKKTPEENPVKEYFFLIVIGSTAVLLVLLAICILLVIVVRWQTIKAKAAQSPGHRGVKYRNINADPENMLTPPEDSPTFGRHLIPANQSNVGVQTDSTIGTSTPGRNDHSNGGRRIQAKGATPDEKRTHDARLSRTRQPQGIRDQGRTRLNGSSKIGEVLPVSRVPPQNSNVVLLSYRGRDPQTNRDQGASNSAKDGVWIARPLAEDLATQRTGRPGGLKAIRDPMDSEAESTSV